jgi:ABC1 atypical kinase-like domain
MCAVAREVAARIGEEIDYRIEATHQTDFADAYRDHPFIRIPEVVSQLYASEDGQAAVPAATHRTGGGDPMSVSFTLLWQGLLVIAIGIVWVVWPRYHHRCVYHPVRDLCVFSPRAVMRPGRLAVTAPAR